MTHHDTHESDEALRRCPWPVGFLERMSRANPDDPQAWSALAEGYLEIGWHNESVDAYLEALRLRPSTYTWLHLGYVYVAAGYYEFARTSYLNAVTLDPTHIEGWKNLYVVGLLLKDYPASLAAAQQAVLLEPGDGGLWTSLGSALACVERYRQSAEAHQHALQFNPTNAGAWNGLAFALRATHQLNDAVEAFQAAIKHSGEDKFAQLLGWVELEKTLALRGEALRIV